jgi:hypothetical protein
MQKLTTEVNTMDVSPQTAYDNLALLEEADVAHGAMYREVAQEVLADEEVSINLRDAIADRLHQANHVLTIKAHTDDDSY